MCDVSTTSVSPSQRPVENPDFECGATLGRVRASVEENDADHVEVFHFEHDQIAALIDLHRKRRLHVEDDGRRHAGVLALELLRVVVLLDLLDRGGLQLQPREIPGGQLARARIVDQHRALRQRVDQRLARRLALELHRPEAVEARRGARRIACRERERASAIGARRCISPVPARCSDPAAGRRARGRPGTSRGTRASTASRRARGSPRPSPGRRP